MKIINNETDLYVETYRQDFEDFLQTQLLSNKIDMENLTAEERQTVVSMDKFTMAQYSIFNYPKDWRRQLTLKEQGVSEEVILKTLKLEALNKSIGAARYNPFIQQYEPLYLNFYSAN